MTRAAPPLGPLPRKAERTGRTLFQAGYGDTEPPDLTEVALAEPLC